MTATHSIAPNLLVAMNITKHRHEVLDWHPGQEARSQIDDHAFSSRRFSGVIDRFRELTGTCNAQGAGRQMVPRF